VAYEHVTQDSERDKFPTVPSVSYEKPVDAHVTRLSDTSLHPVCVYDVGGRRTLVIALRPAGTHHLADSPQGAGWAVILITRVGVPLLVGAPQYWNAPWVHPTRIILHVFYLLYRLGRSRNTNAMHVVSDYNLHKPLYYKSSQQIC
jgi:hypothetical protein